MASPQIARNQRLRPETGGQPLIVAGGLDPGGGAGLLRDVDTALALGARPHAIGTSWTEQSDTVHRVEARDPASVSRALALAIADLRPSAVKIGMAVGPATADALIAGLTGFAGPVVVDPVLATSRGGRLWDAEPAALLPLLRRSTVVTPNAPEAAALSGRRVASAVDAEAAGRILLAQGVAAVVIKGGHLADPHCVTDVLVTNGGTRHFVRERARRPSPRGTGCALATALAVALGRGESIEAAIRRATTWLAGAIADAQRVGRELHLGSGRRT